MKNFEKPLHEFTEEELQERVNQWDPRYGALALYELQRRLQKKNTEEVSGLIKVMREFAEKFDKNAESANAEAKNSNILAKRAVYIALAALIAQLIFSINTEVRCGQITQSNGIGYYSQCYQVFDLGFLGERSIKRPDHQSAL